MKNADYWRKRALALEAQAHQLAADYWQTAQEAFDKASLRLQNAIAVWYQRFADNNQITLTEAKRLLNTRELEEFRWTVEDYIEAGSSISPRNLDKALMKQLENASAKVHISRLEALQTQLHAEAELLYGNHVDGLEGLLGNLYEGHYYRAAYEIQKGVGVGWSLNRLDTAQIEKALETPWTADNVTFRDSCWKNKRALVSELRTNLVQGIIRGDNPAEAANTIAKRFGVEKSKAARLCYTESAHISALSQKDCYNDLNVERFEIVETLDSITCSACGALDGKVFPMRQYEVGMTVPPFHPNCRGCTAPYFEDLDGERIAKDVVTEKKFQVPANTTYEDWKAMQDGKYGTGTVDKIRKMHYNVDSDEAQLQRYQARLGKSGNLKNLEAFQHLKYDDPDGYAFLKLAYADKGIQQRIRSKPEWIVLLEGRQGKHILDHNNYTEGRSYLIISMDEAQELIRRYAGTGEIKRDSSGKWTHQEFVTADRVIGYHINADGVKTPTRRFSIRYATRGKLKGAHIVPAKENHDS